MLRLGGRQTWALSAAACKNAPSTLHPFSSAVQLRVRPSSLHNDHGLAVYSSRRFYSPLPPSPSAPEARTKVEPVFTNANSRKPKPKVDLKPGPRPVNALNAGSDVPQPASGVQSGKTATSSQPTASVTQSTSQPSLPEEKPDPAAVPKPSMIKMAISDVVKAAELGALAPPPADAGKVGKIWHQVKELFKFYVRGLKQILTHRQIVKDIETRVREGRAAGKPEEMTWEEAHFVKTYKEDLIKLIPFLLILLILEEALPLVVLYAPFLLPSTCILPNQRARILWKRDDAQYLARDEVRRILAEAGSPSKVLGASVSDMPNELVTGLAKVFALSTRGPVALHRRRLEKHLAYLVNDDRLLVDESMGSHLDSRNLKVAMSERGFLASVDESNLRAILDKRLRALGEDAGQWKQSSLQFLITHLIESNKDVRPTPVD